MVEEPPPEGERGREEEGCLTASEFITLCISLSVSTEKVGVQPQIPVRKLNKTYHIPQILFILPPPSPPPICLFLSGLSPLLSLPSLSTLPPPPPLSSQPEEEAAAGQAEGDTAAVGGQVDQKEIDEEQQKKDEEHDKDVQVGVAEKGAEFGCKG